MEASMAQLQEDEWPKDGEPTTAEQEGDLSKREGSNPLGKKGCGNTADRAGDEWVIDNVDPDQPVE